MKIRAATFYFFELPCKPFALQQTWQHAREGALVRVNIGEFEGVAELAPLPSVHKETLMQAFTQLRDLLTLWQEKDWSAKLWDGLSLWPSVLWALEQLDMQYQSTSSGEVLPEVVALESAKLRQRDACAGAEAVVKIKIGDLPLAEELERLKGMSAESPQMRLRIDANRAYAVSNWQWDQWKNLPIDFIEEPTQHFHPELFHTLPIPIALDETLWDLPPTVWPKDSIWVIKPSRIMGGRALLHTHAAKQIVLSSAYDAGVSMLHFAYLQQRKGFRTPGGFGTYEYFKEDLLAEPLNLNGIPLQRLWPLPFSYINQRVLRPC